VAALINSACLKRFEACLPYSHLRNCWQESDKNYRPVDQRVVDALTRPLSQADVLGDAGWLEDSAVLVTGNTNRAVFNACFAKVMARRGNKLLFRWRKRLLGDVPEPVQELIYREAEQPELFAYFMEGGHPGKFSTTLMATFSSELRTGRNVDPTPWSGMTKRLLRKLSSWRTPLFAPGTVLLTCHIPRNT
jgi:hypothetical protein